MQEYVFVDPTTDSVVEVNRDSFIAVTDAGHLLERSDRVYLNAADDVRFSIIPVIESIEHLEGMDDPKPVKVAGFLEKQEDVVLPAEAVWYVRSMVARGIKELEDSIEECAKLAAKTDGDVPAWAKQSLAGAVAYNRQLLSEARKAIPDSFL